MSNISRRGFGSMTPERRAEIAAMGGKAAHAKGTARVFAKGKEAALAGSKGGRQTAVNRRRNRGQS